MDKTTTAKDFDKKIMEVIENERKQTLQKVLEIIEEKIDDEYTNEQRYANIKLRELKQQIEEMKK